MFASIHTRINFYFTKQKIREEGPPANPCLFCTALRGFPSEGSCRTCRCYTCQYCLYHCNNLWPLFCSQIKKSSGPCQSARTSRRNSATGDLLAPITDFMAKMMMVAPPPLRRLRGLPAPPLRLQALQLRLLAPAPPLLGAQLQAIPPLRALVEFPPAFSKAE